ncbi:hypothetical protein GGP41_005994 [Bipolaris sorokiniana]|uniref:Uncharacterized protein n=1 Tax=Cochliobolus sativus TaxID=45130 RepID=A0A8H5ZEV5_COCSA|nr:hypothetical protein GGP41_005994 [Bipolaris sorokiniana]
MLRSAGDHAEVQIYQTLGLMRYLESLLIMLKCTNYLTHTSVKAGLPAKLDLICLRGEAGYAGVTLETHQNDVRIEEVNSNTRLCNGKRTVCRYLETPVARDRSRLERRVTEYFAC